MLCSLRSFNPNLRTACTAVGRGFAVFVGVVAKISRVTVIFQFLNPPLTSELGTVALKASSLTDIVFKAGHEEMSF